MSEVPPAAHEPPKDPNIPYIPPEGKDLSNTDQYDLKKIGRHTTPFGRIATIGFIVTAVALTGLYWWSKQRQEEERARFEAIGQLSDPAKVTSELRAIYPTLSDPDLRFRVLKNLGAYKDVQAVPLMIEALEEGGVIRRAAAWALAQVGLPEAAPAKAKLLEVLPDTDELDRDQVVWTLAVLKEPQAADAILAAFVDGSLKGQEGFDPKIVADLLGPEKLSSEELVQHPSEPVRRLVAITLSETGSPESIDPLAKLIDGELAKDKGDQSIEIIRAAVAGLGRTGDPRAAVPLMNLVRKEPDRLHLVVDALRRSASASDLEALVSRVEAPAARREIVRLLAETHDPGSADKLVSLLSAEDEEVHTTAALALGELGDTRAAPALLRLADEGKDSAQDRAMVLLRNVAQAIPSGDLLALRKEHPAHNASILRALGRTKDASVGKVLVQELKGDDGPSAAIALAELGSDAYYSSVLAMAKRPPKVTMGALSASDRKAANEDLLRQRRASILALGHYARPDGANTLMEIVEDGLDDYELRSLAAISLGRLAGPEQLKTVVRAVHGTDLDERTRRYYAQALWQIPRPELNPILLSLIESDAPSPVRRAAAIAVGYASGPETDERLSDLLSKESTVREAALAIALGGGEEVVAELIGALEENRDLREVLHLYFTEEGADWTLLLTRPMFDSGQIWRRLRAAEQLKQGAEKYRYPYAQASVLHVLRVGWDGPDGVPVQEVRERLYAALTGDDPEVRGLAARTLALLPEQGLLLKARKANGPGAEEAHAALRATTKSKGSGD